MRKLSPNALQVIVSAAGAAGSTAALLMSNCPDLAAPPALHQALTGASATLAVLFVSIAIEGLVGAVIRARLATFMRRCYALMN